MDSRLRGNDEVLGCRLLGLGIGSFPLWGKAGVRGLVLFLGIAEAVSPHPSPPPKGEGNAAAPPKGEGGMLQFRYFSIKFAF